MVSGLALVHQRYSTNTFPTWDLAHPFRFLCHNGEINTLRGNINWMHAREALFSSPLFGEDIAKILPIATPGASDSAILDNAVELLYHTGRSLPHCVAMLIPEAWQNHKTMSDDKKAFYEYHSCLMEPWDGPASIAFTDGKVIGAVLDRNGLRPSRYTVTKDGFVIMALRDRRAGDRPGERRAQGAAPARPHVPGRHRRRGASSTTRRSRRGWRRASRTGRGSISNWCKLADLPEPARRIPSYDLETLRDAAAGVRLHAGGPAHPDGPDGRRRRGADRLDGHRHAAGRAQRPGRSCSTTTSSSSSPR